MNYQAAEQKYGTVYHNGREYALTSDADYTNRLLPGGYVNLQDAQDGDRYDFEMQASAMDKNGHEFAVVWIFTGTKGDNDPELSDYDYSMADEVTQIT